MSSLIGYKGNVNYTTTATPKSPENTLFDWLNSQSAILTDTLFVGVQICGTYILENYNVSTKLKYTILSKSCLASYLFYCSQVLSPTATSTVLN